MTDIEFQLGPSSLANNTCNSMRQTRNARSHQLLEIKPRVLLELTASALTTRPSYVPTSPHLQLSSPQWKKKAKSKKKKEREY